MEDEKWEPTGGVEVKGKGMMQTYLWVPDPTPGHTEKEVLTGPLPSVTSEVLPCTLIKTTQALLQQLSTSLPLVGRPSPPLEQWLSHQHAEDSFLVPVCNCE
ncbi:hypothetical protein DUNSADRAFT_12477 [Dunaliella salina]|uniref:Uncharacterized protein n=1 Tax=Dunaliella salina TaxID=3046 RepID=A0ABQ7H3W6_DUNSA|nr:hypothetical protein DUNSADRAFT_12477 [Dunaliella salina]|eukprot:KAF5841549.1 hypothetical protein DUNSADRAFT_12477 [Dunaliella salina]